MMITAKMATFQYTIPPEACHTMLNSIQDGPIHPLHIQNSCKRYYPNSQAATPQMMFNFCLKCKKLQNKYGSLVNVHKIKANAVFDPKSLGNALEHQDTNLMYSKVFKESMQDVGF